MIQSILHILRAYAQKHAVPIADDPTTQYIESLLKKIRPKYCLEIGSAIWYSTLTIAHNIQKWGGKLCSCEVSYPSYMVALHYMYHSQLSNILLTYGDFIKFPPTYYHNSFDFVFVDGQKNQYLDYYLKLQERIHDDTVLVFDDVISYKSKITPLTDYLDQHSISYEIVQLSEEDGILVID